MKNAAEIKEMPTYQKCRLGFDETAVQLNRFKIPRRRNSKENKEQTTSARYFREKVSPNARDIITDSVVAYFSVATEETQGSHI